MCSDFPVRVSWPPTSQGGPKFKGKSGRHRKTFLDICGIRPSGQRETETTIARKRGASDAESAKAQKVLETVMAALRRPGSSRVVLGRFPAAMHHARRGGRFCRPARTRMQTRSCRGTCIYAYLQRSRSIAPWTDTNRVMFGLYAVCGDRFTDIFILW